MMEQQNLLEEVLAEIDYNFGDDKALQDNDQGYQLKAQQEQEQEQWHAAQDAYYAKLLGEK